MTRAWFLVACLVLAGWAAAGTGGGGGGTAPADPEPDDPVPTASEYRRAVSANASVDVFYEVYACSRLATGTYTDVVGVVSTASSPHKSSYMAHNVRVYVDGGLVARSTDYVQSVSGASETNYITSIPTTRVTSRISCPKAMLANLEARGWHKANSIHGHSYTLYTSDAYYGS